MVESGFSPDNWTSNIMVQGFLGKNATHKAVEFMAGSSAELVNHIFNSSLRVVIVNMHVVVYWCNRARVYFGYPPCSIIYL
ncbi:hypothetical protein FRX31_032957 [Thalictrum thalictroides]|uniref:Uncharacterized protein n=1 Tax=Thalictrum thalictroides TaxID=46969 RepID=A0A7J6UYI1_THATH|nr:hypothetical protein FRX31_032957 [Thalictrum thalictroides]